MAIKPAKGSVSIIDKATKPLKSITSAFQNLSKQTKKTNKDLSSTQKAITSINHTQNQLNRTYSGMKKNTSNIGSQAVGVLALGLSFKQALQPAIDFEQSMKDLESVAFGAADSTVPVAKNMKLLSDQAKQLGASTSFSATQAAEGQLFLAKAGFKTNQILQAMPSLLDLAAASGTDLGRSSDILSDLLGAFGTTAKDTGKLADILAAATSSANVDMETLFETLKVAAPIGVAAGQSMEGITTATALLGNVGIKGSMAGTALKNAFTNLASPATEGAKVLKELGVQTADAQGNMLPMQQIMLNLGKSAKKLSQTKRIKAFDAVFGKLAMAGAINLEKAVTGGDFDKMLKNLSSAEGVSKRMANIRMDSTKGSIVQLMSATEGLAIAFGTFLAPMIRTTAELLTKFSEPAQSFVKENKTAVQVVGLVVGGLIAFKIAALAATATIWLAAPAVKALSLSLGALKGAIWLVNLAMKANPIGIFITLAGVAIAIASNWEKVTSVFSKLWDIIKNFDFDNIMGSLSKVGSLFGFGGGSENKVTNENIVKTQNSLTPSPQNNNANITVNIADGKVKSVENDGNFKANTFLNNGVQQ